jgi:hypothetical protein
VTILGTLVCARSARLSLVASLAVAASALTACGASGLSFVQDKRVEIVRPHDRSKVTLPVKVAWTVKDFAVGDGQGAFGVFVDRAPQPSGQTLAWLFRGDRSCKGTGAPLCAKPQFLAQHSVYSTTERTFTVEQVIRLAGNQTNRHHEVTVVLLDAGGKRVGEGAWSVQFKVRGDK